MEGKNSTTMPIKWKPEEKKAEEKQNMSLYCLCGVQKMQQSNLTQKS